MGEQKYVGKIYNTKLAPSRMLSCWQEVLAACINTSEDFECLTRFLESDPRPSTVYLTRWLILDLESANNCLALDDDAEAIPSSHP
jgi:hypothetical protein